MTGPTTTTGGITTTMELLTAHTDPTLKAEALARQAIEHLGKNIDGVGKLHPIAQAFWDNIVGPPADLRTCAHTQRPMVVWITAVLPGVALCEKCVFSTEHMALAEAHADETSDCDSCKLSGIEMFTEFSIQRGPVIVFGHLCEACIATGRKEMALARLTR